MAGATRMWRRSIADRRAGATGSAGAAGPRLAVSALLILALSGCTPAGRGGNRAALTPSSATPKEITVSAAASLAEPFQRIAETFEAHEGTAKVSFVFGASGALAQQIEAGAPVDALASASREVAQELIDNGLMAAETVVPFAGGDLVVVVPPDSALTVASLKDLTSPEVERVALGEPKTVPAGDHAEQSLTEEGLWSKVLPKAVFGASVRQVYDYVARGEVQAGFVYASDAKGKTDVKLAYPVPKSNHRPIVYVIGVVKGAKRPELAQRFVDLVLSPQGQAVLARYGYKKAGR